MPAGYSPEGGDLDDDYDQIVEHPYVAFISFEDLEE
jgi:hypothetical protein